MFKFTFRKYPKVTGVFSLDTLRVPGRRLVVKVVQTTRYVKTLEYEVQSTSIPWPKGWFSLSLTGEVLPADVLLRLERVSRRLYPKRTGNLNELFQTLVLATRRIAQELGQDAKQKHHEPDIIFLQVLEKQLIQQLR